MALTSAYNQETGQYAVLINGEWVVASSMAENEQKQKAFLVNNEWMQEEEKTTPYEDRPVGQRLLEYPLGAAESIVRGGYNFLGANAVGGLAGMGHAAATLDPSKFATTTEAVRDTLTKDPMTAASKYFDENIIAPVFEKAKEVFGRNWYKMLPHDQVTQAILSLIPKTEKGQLQREAVMTSIGEFGFDAIMAGLTGKGAIAKLRERKATQAKALEEQTQRDKATEEIKAKMAAEEATAQPMEFTSEAAVPQGPRGLEITQRGGTSAPPVERFQRGTEVDIPRPTITTGDTSQPGAYRAMESIDYTPVEGSGRPTLVERAGKNRDAQELAKTINKQQDYVSGLERDITNAERMRESTLRGDPQQPRMGGEPRGWKDSALPDAMRRDAGIEPQSLSNLNLRVKDLRNRLEGARENLDTYKSQFETKLENIQNRPLPPIGQRGSIGDAPPPKIGGKRATVEEQIKYVDFQIKQTQYDIKRVQDVVDRLEKGDFSDFRYAQQFPELMKEKTTPLEYRNETTKWTKDLQKRLDDLVIEKNQLEGKTNNFPSNVTQGLFGPKGPWAGPKNQRGAIDPTLLTAGLNKIVNRAGKRGESNKVNLPEQPRKPVLSSKDIADLAKGQDRPLSEFVKNLKPEELVDIPDTTSQRVVGSTTNASFWAHWAKDSPLATYVVNRFNNVVRTTQLAINQLKEGTTFGLFTHKVDPNSPKGVWSRLSSKDRDAVIDVANEFNGLRELSGGELAQLGLSESAANAYRVFRKALDDGLNLANEVRPDNLINRLPGWFPKVREGDFKLSFYEKDPITGKAVAGKAPIYSDLFWTRGFGGLFGRSKMIKEMTGKLPEDVVMGLSEVDRGTHGNPYNVSTLPFEILTENIGKGDPRAKVIESLIKEYRGRRGFGRHAIQRKHVGGGELTSKNFYTAFESYMDSIGIYRQNALMRAIDVEFKATPELKTPRLKEWIGEYATLASGGFKPGWAIDALDSFVQATARTLTLGQKGGESGSRFIRKANQYFISKALFFYNIPFLVSQGVQPFAFSPQWLAKWQNTGMTAGVGSSMMKGEMQALRYVTGTAEPGFKNLMQYQLARGNIDPTMIHAMDVLSDSKSTLSRWAGHAMGRTLVQQAESLGRFQTTAIGYEFAKNSGMKGKDLNMWVERFVNDVMTDYSKQERPGWVGKTGVVGALAGPLSTFATNYWTTTALFLKEVAQNPSRAASYKPMGLHVAQTALWAGLTGMLGMQAVDGIIWLLKFFNVIDAVDKPAPGSEWIRDNTDIPDAAAYGLTSVIPQAFGLPAMNLGASMNAPDMTMPSWKSAPGAKLTHDVITTLVGAVKGQTKADVQNFMKSFLPNSINHLMDVYDVDINTMDFSSSSIREREVGEIVPNTNQRGFGQNRPTEDDRAARMLGTRTLEDVRGRDRLYSAKTNEAMLSEQQRKLVDLGADSMMYPNRGDISDYMDKAMENGMNYKQYMANVWRVMKEREMTAQEQFTGQIPRTQNQLRREQQLQPLSR